MTFLLKPIFIIICLFIILDKYCYADFVSYNSTVTIQLKTDSYTILHHHDYTERGKDERLNEIHYGRNAIFNDTLNTFSFIIVTNSKTGDTLFKKPCPPFTKVLISKDEKYFIGLSNIKLRNPFQLVVFNLQGEVEFKRRIHINYKNVTYTDNEIRLLVNKYPEDFVKYTLMGDIEKHKQFWKINTNNIPQFRDDSSGKISTVGIFDSLLPNKRESTSNYVKWFCDTIKEIEIVEKNGRIDELYFLDNANTLRKIPNDIIYCDVDYFINNGYLNRATFNEIKHSKTSLFSTPQYKYPSCLQFGNLYYYFTDIKTFLSQNELQFIDKSSYCDSNKVLSFKLLIIDENKEKSKGFEVKSANIPTEIKDKLLIGSDKIRQIYFTEIKVACYKEGEFAIRELPPIVYSIIE